MKRAVGIVVHENQLLVIHRKNHREFYVFPGGHVEGDETVEAAVIREIKEEASLDVELGREVYELHYDNGDTHYYYLCDYLSGTPTLMPDSNEFAENQLGEESFMPQWMPISEIEKATLFPLPVRDRLLKDLVEGFAEEVVIFDLPAFK